LAHHTAAKAENALVGASPTGDDADRVAQGLVPGHGQKVPGRPRQGVQILNQGTGPRGHDPALVPKGDPQDPGPGLPVMDHAQKLGKGGFPLTFDDDVDFRVKGQGHLAVKGHVGAAHEGNHPRISLFDGSQYPGGPFKIHGDAVGPHHIRTKGPEFGLEFGFRISPDNIIQNPDFCPGGLAHGGNIGQAQGR